VRYRRALADGRPAGGAPRHGNRDRHRSEGISDRRGSCAEAGAAASISINRAVHPSQTSPPPGMGAAIQVQDLAGHK
jgi:hypothetical protein